MILLDELGCVPASRVDADLLFDVISTAYERTNLIVTCNRPFESLTEVLGSERLIGATSIGSPSAAGSPRPGRELPAPMRQGPDAISQAGDRQLGCPLTAWPTSPPGPWPRRQPPSNL